MCRASPNSASPRTCGLWACDEQMIDLNLPFSVRAHGWSILRILRPHRCPSGDGLGLAGVDGEPWDAIQVALNRSHPTAADATPLLPEEAIDLTTALRAYTAGSARLLRSTDNGRIRPGMRANLAIASANPFELSPTDIAGITNELTICDGRIVHDALPPHAPTTTASAQTNTDSAS